MIQPPSVGPSVGPTITPMPKIAIAVPRSSRGKTSNRIAWAVEISAAAADALQHPPPTSSSREWALPQRNEAKVKSMIEPV